MRNTLKMREISDYLRRRILPYLPQGWHVHKIMVLRCDRYLIQGIAFDSSSYSRRFVPTVFVQLLPIFTDFIHLTLGNRLKQEKKGETIPVGNDWWIDWDAENEALALEIVNAVERQAQPPISQPLTLEAIMYYLESSRHLRKSKNWGVQASFGVVYGLLGEREGSLKHFYTAKKYLQERVKQSPEIYEHILSNVENLAAAAISSEEFESYCHLMALKTAQALKLPKKCIEATSLG